MPQTTYTAFDTTGQTKLTDMDMLAEQRRREMADQAFRGALLNNQNNMQREGWNRQDALNQQNMTAQERIAAANNQTQLAIGGNFQDRTNANQQLALLQMRPQQTLADLEQNKWSEGADLRKAKAAGEIGRLNFENNIFGQLTGGMGQGQPQGSGMNAMDPKNLRIAMAFLNKDPSLLKDPFDQDFREVVKAQVASGAMSPAEAMTALKSGDPTLLRSREVSAIAPEQQIAALENRVSDFGERDAATIGFDPTDTDVSDIVRQRDQVAQALKSQRPQLSPEQAMEGANWIIEQRLLPNQNRWGTEWIAKLRQALRGGGMTGGFTGGMGTTSDRGY